MVRSGCVEMCWRFFRHNHTDTAVRVEFFGDEIDRITEIDVLTGEGRMRAGALWQFSRHLIMLCPQEKIKQAIGEIEEELEERVRYFKGEDKLLEAQRIAERTNFDIEMLRETGFCSGIENYSRHLAGLEPGAPPYTLIDYFPDDFLIIMDESHMTIPQIARYVCRRSVEKVNTGRLWFPSAIGKG